MRIIGIIPNKEQVGGLVDSLRNAGFERKDIIISDMNKTFDNKSNITDDVYIKTETDSIAGLTPFTQYLEDKADSGIVVAVETSKHETSRVREIMEQYGASKVFQD